MDDIKTNGLEKKFLVGFEKYNFKTLEYKAREGEWSLKWTKEGVRIWAMIE